MQAISRSLYARFVPPAQSGEFFGFFNMLGRFAAIIGPSLVAITGLLTGSSRLGILSVAVVADYRDGVAGLCARAGEWAVNLRTSILGSFLNRKQRLNSSSGFLRCSGSVLNAPTTHSEARRAFACRATAASPRFGITAGHQSFRQRWSGLALPCRHLRPRAPGQQGRDELAGIALLLRFR